MHQRVSKADSSAARRSRRGWVAAANPVRRGLMAVVVLWLASSSAHALTIMPGTPLISTGAVWKYLDNGSNPGTAWRAPEFDDDAWSSGPAKLGYGSGGEATVVGFGPQSTNKYITTYFRHAFTLQAPEAVSNLLVRLLRDDGAVVYLNGVEVFRSNMPGGAVTYTTRATTSVGGTDETTYYSTNVSSALLRAGTNVVAIELHQVNPTSSDLGFDLALLANNPNNPPTVNISSPTNSAMFSLRLTSSVPVSASVSDADGSVARVAFWLGESLLGEATASPYRVFWTNQVPGVFGLRAVATDNLGAMSTSAVAQVTWVANFPPQVTWLEPKNGQTFPAPGDLRIRAGASDADGRVTLLELYEGNRLLGFTNTPPLELVWPDVPAGTYELSARATDESGVTITSSLVRVVFDPSLLVAAGSLWRYLDDGSNQGVGWRAVDFTDATWRAGAAPLGYGDGDEATVVDFGPNANNKHITTYFRHAFRVPDPSAATNLVVRVQRDDGAVVYLNGEEVFRSNMPTNAVQFGTLAVASVAGADETNYFRTLTSAGRLVAGTNVVAVEVHQNTTNSSDLSFDLILGINASNSLPSITLTNPSPGDLFSTNDTVLIGATASDADAGIARVEFFAGETKLGQRSEPPFTYAWSGLVPGIFQLTARVTDQGDATRTTAPVQIQVLENYPPVVRWLGPTNDSFFRLGTDITLEAEAAERDGTILRVEFYALDQLLGETSSAPFRFAWAQPGLGEYDLRAVAVDDGGLRRTSEVARILVTTNLMPTVSIRSPAHNSVWPARQDLVVDIDAQDRDGTVERVVLYLGATPVAETAASAPYRLVLTNLAAGHYLLRAEATDNDAGRQLSQPVQVALDGSRHLIPTGATWKYFDRGTNLGTAWRNPGFNDQSWAAGAAPLGYGDGDERTVVSFGTNANNKHVTTYFRHAFAWTNNAPLTGLNVRLLRDDGGVVYLNGSEIFRSNMPTNDILFNTLASTGAEDDDERDRFYRADLNPALLVDGTNVLAVEIHQASITSSDLSFDLALAGFDRLTLTRGPYLQLPTPRSITLRWRTDRPSESRVEFGRHPAQLDQSVTDLTLTNEHILALTNLLPGARYYYAVGTTTERVAEGSDQFFTTFPEPGTPGSATLWILGDSGTADANARAVRDAFYHWSGTTLPDLWLLLGDLAYENGTEAEFQAALFDMFPTTLKQVPIFSVLSNHDVAQVTDPPPTLPYFQIFSFPAQGQCGGVPSGSEHYYAFDSGPIHVVCLDTWASDLSPTGPMAEWLRRDLAANHQPWLVALGANPPYGLIGNNSDTKSQQVGLRSNILPILEAHGLDLYFAGDSHLYERSHLLDGHYGTSTTLVPSMIVDATGGQPEDTGPYNKGRLGPVPHRGAVYTTVGSSGHLDDGTNVHPALVVSRRQLGSVMLEVNPQRLDVRFLSSAGSIEDHFAILKPLPRNQPPSAPPHAETVVEDQPLSFRVPASDPEADPLSLQFSRAPRHGRLLAPRSNGDLIPIPVGVLLNLDANLEYRPLTNFHGADEIGFIVLDGYGGAITTAVQIAVLPVNDPPSFLPGADPSVPEDAGPQGIPGWATDIRLGPANESNQTARFVVAVDRPDLFQIRPAIDAAGTLAYHPASDAFGTATLTVQLRDDGGTDLGGEDASPEISFHIVLQPVNDAPQAESQRFTVSEDAALPILLVGRDVDADPLRFTLLSLPAHGTLSGIAPDLIYQPALNYFGPDSLRFRVEDPWNESGEGVMDLEVMAVNDPPHALARLEPISSLTPSGGTPLVLSPDGTHALVRLDASQSSDVEGHRLSFTWFDGSAPTPVALGEVVTNRFAVGMHPVRLVADDGTDAGEAALLFEVLTPSEGVEVLMLEVYDSPLPLARKRPLVATLKNAMASFDRGSLGAGVNQVQAFQNKVRAQVIPWNPTLAGRWMRLSEELVNTVQPTPNR